MLNEPVAFVAIGFCLLLSIYVLVALLYGVYTPELFPTDVRLRANGICNMLGRGATIVSPFIVVGLFKAYGVAGVTGADDRPAVVQIVAVLVRGIEPARRGLEDAGAGGVREHASCGVRAQPLPRRRQGDRIWYFRQPDRVGASWFETARRRPPHDGWPDFAAEKAPYPRGRRRRSSLGCGSIALRRMASRKDWVVRSFFFSYADRSALCGEGALAAGLEPSRLIRRCNRIKPAVYEGRAETRG